MSPLICRIFLFLIWLCHTSSMILVPHPGIESGPITVRALSPNWTSATPQNFSIASTVVLYDPGLVEPMDSEQWI